MSLFRDLLERRKINKELIKSAVSNSLVNIDNLPDLESLTPEERKVLFEILNEYSVNGKSDILDNLWKQDYDEIPVEIETFICDPYYLGKATNNGTAIYPFWMDTLKKLYTPNARYFEVILSGAIGLGKTTISNIGIAYMLYKLLCLKNPQSYYDLIPGDTIVVAFFNVTLELSQGVAFNNLQSMLKESPWFLAHGTVTGRTHKLYTPGKNVSFRIGSTASHGLGQNIFCLFKGTEVVTIDGVFPIETLVEKDLWVYSYDENGGLVISDKCTVKESGITNEVIEIEMENDFIIKCTPDHQWLIKDDITGLEYYTPASFIKDGDNIISF